MIATLFGIPRLRPVCEQNTARAAARPAESRADLRNDASRYEAVAIALVHPRGTNIAEVVADYPLTSSPLAFDRFFEKLYQAYDLRFVYTAPALAKETRRLEWVPNSPAIEQAGCVPRLANR